MTVIETNLSVIQANWSARWFGFVSMVLVVLFWFLVQAKTN